ncbi:hypothetical protein PG993_007425 [Apiospora rasikravindrae]|uniref:Uncharacterized protein n=1 Tax=Apiospora rasikravindrae TaxID=990691 RepID=A0ABR1SXG3_9PEZI
MAVSSVILGLIPVVIQQLGATTIEIGALSLRRPLLAAVLALGSPAVIPKRASDYTPQSVWWNGHNNRQAPTGSKQAMRKQVLWHGALHYAVYPIALASLGNVAYLSYQLGYQAASAFAVGTTFLPMLWAFLALLIHVVGASTLHLRYRIQPADPRTIGKGRMTRWLMREFVYHYSESPRIRLDIVGGWREVWFEAVTWLLYTATSVHLAFGTMVLASLLFISIADATTILGRFIASTIVNRLILVALFLTYLAAAAAVSSQALETSLSPRTDRPVRTLSSAAIVGFALT